MRFVIKLVLVLFLVGLYFALAVWGEGGPRAFFADSPLTALALATAALAVASLSVGGNLSSGEHEDRSNRWVLWAFFALGLMLGYVPAYTDRIGVWTFGGEALRWFGVCVFLAGGVLRLWPVAVLGRRFSGLVAIQKDHRLVTNGICVDRPPELFRSSAQCIGMGSDPALVWCLLCSCSCRWLAALKRRSACWRRNSVRPMTCTARTKRLIPGIY